MLLERIKEMNDEVERIRQHLRNYSIPAVDRQKLLDQKGNLLRQINLLSTRDRGVRSASLSFNAKDLRNKRMGM